MGVQLGAMLADPGFMTTFRPLLLPLLGILAACEGEPLRRPQDPVPPYPYNTADVTFPADDGAVLAGTLTWPPGPGPFTTVVLVSGSGPNDRDETVAGHHPFLVIADALTRAGVATFRYDKRGVAASGGDYDVATTVDFSADARAALRMVRAGGHFATAATGFVGHSEGGMVGPMAADGNPDAQFLVLLAPPGVPGDEILISQSRAIAAADGASTAELDRAEEVNRRVYACHRDAPTTDALTSCLVSVLGSVGLSGKRLSSQVEALSSPWMRFFITYDPAPVLTRTTVPVLVLNGRLDLQVLPELNLPPIRRALQTAGNQDATVEVLDGLNHLFQHTTNGSPSEYQRIDETIAPEMLSRLTAWIGAR